jgi:hypothetical protein
MTGGGFQRFRRYGRGVLSLVGALLLAGAVVFGSSAERTPRTETVHIAISYMYDRSQFFAESDCAVLSKCTFAVPVIVEDMPRIYGLVCIVEQGVDARLLA